MRIFIFKFLGTISNDIMCKKPYILFFDLINFMFGYRIFNQLMGNFLFLIKFIHNFNKSFMSKSTSFCNPFSSHKALEYGFTTFFPFSRRTLSHNEIILKQESTKIYIFLLVSTLIFFVC